MCHRQQRLTTGQSSERNSRLSSVNFSEKFCMYAHCWYIRLTNKVPYTWMMKEDCPFKVVNMSTGVSFQHPTSYCMANLRLVLASVESINFVQASAVFVESEIFVQNYLPHVCALQICVPLSWWNWGKSRRPVQYRVSANSYMPDNVTLMFKCNAGLLLWKAQLMWLSR